MLPWFRRMEERSVRLPVPVALRLAFVAARPYWENGEQRHVFLLIAATTAVGSMAQALPWLLHVNSGAPAGRIFVLTASAVALVLFRHLKRRQRVESVPPAGACGAGEARAAAAGEDLGEPESSVFEVRGKNIPRRMGSGGMGIRTNGPG